MTKKKLIKSTISVLFLALLSNLCAASESKNSSTSIKFSSDNARYVGSSGSLHLSGKVVISYKNFTIRSDTLEAKRKDTNKNDFEIIEAKQNIYFSNNSDLMAKGDLLHLDLEKKFLSIEGDVEFVQGETRIKAKKINIDLETETVELEKVTDSIIKN